MYISFNNVSLKQFLIISINPTSDRYFEKLIQAYQSDDVSFTLLSKTKANLPNYSNICIPVKSIISIISWILFFRKNEKYRIKLELHLSYFLLRLLDKFFSFQGIFLYGDRHGFVEPAALKLCKKRNIKSYVIAVARSSGVNEFFNKLERLPKVKFDAHVVLSKNEVQFEHQICDIVTRRTFCFFPKTFYAALKDFGYASEHPWINGGGFSDAIIVDREVEARRLKYYGCMSEKILRSSKLLATESDQYDDINKEKNLNERVLGIVAPVYYEHGLCDYETSINILKNIIEIAKAHFDKVLISLHPKMEIENYKYLRSEVCDLFQSEIDRLFAASRLVCVPAGSSIYADAIEAGMRCLVFNPLELQFDVNYEQYHKFGLRYCTTEQQMLPMLSELDSHEQPFLKLNRLSDGNVLEKIIQG